MLNSETSKLNQNERGIVFVSKATPGDDEFALWLAPRLEAAGYSVFADIICLDGGERWRRTLTKTLQDNAIKMLLCCSDETLAREGVQEEIGIATEVARELGDPKFIIPLRLKPYKKIFGIGELQYLDFVGGWANGLGQLLDTLEKEEVPKTKEPKINPAWASVRRRMSLSVEKRPERLTSNWIEIRKFPKRIYFIEPRGPAADERLHAIARQFSYPTYFHDSGIFSFASLSEIEKELQTDLGMIEKLSVGPKQFASDGIREINLAKRDASNILTALIRESWERKCRDLGLYEYLFSNQTGFHITPDLSPLGKQVKWQKKPIRRAAMCNKAGQNIWLYGLTAIPHLWPAPHFRLKPRVIFADFDNQSWGVVLKDKSKQHKLRRSRCKGWRNKQWHGRMMAFLKIIADEDGSIRLPASPESQLMLARKPLFAEVPATTPNINDMDENSEDSDASTFGDSWFDVDEQA